MTRALRAILILIFATVSLPAYAQNDQKRELVKEDSRIEFHASSTFAKVVGVFHSWEADLKMSGDKFETASLEIEIEAESVTTGSGLRDKEAKGKNFFEVKEYPKIRFVSKSITPDSDPSKFRMDADLTLRGITKPVSVAITLRPQENGHQHVDGDFSFNRRDFGMTHNAPLNKVANTVEVQFHLHVKDAAVPAAQLQPRVDR
ncbi:MAG TPA: YceI family protein [Candidatus Acidoferrales bacterium]|nr:YceI family protein [Candidatus Acidoferrales bacterium]